MAEDSHRLLLPSLSGMSSLVPDNSKQYSGCANVNRRSSSQTMRDDLSSWPVCRHYPECEICEQCAKHDFYQKRVSSISQYIRSIEHEGLSVACVQLYIRLL